MWRSPGVSYVDFGIVLDQLVGQGRVGAKWAYYCLPGEEASVEKRRQAVVYNDQKLKKAKRAVSFIHWVPFLKAVLVCNSVGREVATKDSDIDVLVIAEKNRIWIVRFFTNAVLRLFRLRTYGHRDANRICLSFFIDTANLNLGPWRAIPEDIHFAYWLHQMIPVFDPENWFEKLLLANVWTNELLPHRQTSPFSSAVRSGLCGRVVRRFLEISWRGLYGTVLEKQAKDMQWMKLKLAVKEKANQSNNSIVLQDGIVKLHEHDARAGYREAWLTKVNTLYVRTS